MKKRLLLSFFSLVSVILNAQNLVINPSFENTSSNCANFGGEGFGTDLLDWDNANSNAPGDSCSSPDLFSACNTLPFIGGPSPTNMPNSVLGFQRSRTGTRHAGIITYAPGLAAGCTAVGGDNYREYIQGRLTTPLTAGQTYCVSMYVSLGDQVVWATNNIGVRFTNQQYLRDACANGNNSLINLTPQLNYTCSPITDTVNWVRIQWNYTATGGEQYFTIGNFYNNANTTVGCNNSSAGTNPYAYYYIDDVSITPNSCCAATVATVPTQCVTGNPITLTAIAPPGQSCNPTVSGTWSGPGITNTSNGTFNPAVAGVGTHTITYNLSCGGTATTTIVVNPCATLTLCQEQNGNITVSGGTGPYQWQTSTQQQDCSGCFLGQCLPPICNGTTVTVYNTFFTGTSAPQPVNPPFRIIDAASNTLQVTTLAGIQPCSCGLTVSTTGAPASCGNNNGSATVNVTAGAGPYTYSWNTGANTPSISGVAGGTYTVTVTNSSCSVTSTVTVPSTPAVTIATSATNTSCGNNNGSAAVNITGGNGPFTYNWNTGAVTSSISNLQAGTYNVTVVGANDCIATASVTIAPSTAITVTPVSSTNANCNQADGSATVSASGGNGNYTYSWNIGGNTNSINNVATGTYTVTVNDGTCSTTQNILVGQNTTMQASVSGTGVTCASPNTGSVNLDVTGGTPGYTYLWNTGAVTQDLLGVAAGEYTVTITDDAGCIITSSYTIAAPQLPQGTFVVTDETCDELNDGEINLSVSGGTAPYTYFWSTGDTTQDIEDLNAGSYTVIITDANGCNSTITDTVGPGLQFGIVVTANDSLLTASTAPNYQWYFNGVIIPGANSQTYVATQSGQYSVTTNVSPCKFGSNTVTVIISSVAEQSVFNSVKVFPNPATDEVNIYVNLNKPQKLALTLYDALGRKIMDVTPGDKGNAFQYTIPAYNLPDGMYFITIAGKNERTNAKVLIRK